MPKPRDLGRVLSQSRTFAWLKGFRAIRTRHTCRGSNYLALVHFACALILGRRIEAAIT